MAWVIRPMPAYNTRSGASRLAAQSGAGTAPDTAESRAGLDPNIAGSSDGVSTTPSVNTVTMAEMPQSIKDPSVLLLRAEFKAANITVDNIVTEIDKHIADVELAKASNDVPKEMLFDFSTRLS